MCTLNDIIKGEIKGEIAAIRTKQKVGEASTHSTPTFAFFFTVYLKPRVQIHDLPNYTTDTSSPSIILCAWCIIPVDFSPTADSCPHYSPTFNSRVGDHDVSTIQSTSA